MEGSEEVLIDEWRGQKFAEYATVWERAHSSILNNRTTSVRPVINLNGTVVGHAGIFSGDEIFVLNPTGKIPVTYLPLKQLLFQCVIAADRRFAGKRLVS